MRKNSGAFTIIPFIVAFLYTPLRLPAAVAPQVIWEWHITYDDNIFCLSPKEIDSFRYRVNPQRFPYESADDCLLTVAGRVTGQLKDGSSGEFGVKLHQFLTNQEKTYGLMRLRINRPIKPIGELALSYALLPDYCIRYYRSLRTGSYEPCRFREHLLAGEFKKVFRALTFTALYGFECDDYISAFDYYDTRAHRIGGNLTWRPLSNFNPKLLYEFKMAKARGPQPDISYIEHRWGFEVRSGPKRHSRIGFTVGYTFEYRAYTADDDPLHRGRVDETQTMNFEGSYRLKPLTILVRYGREWRDTNSSYSTEVDEVKDYSRNAVSLGVKLPLKARF